MTRRITSCSLVVLALLLSAWTDVAAADEAWVDECTAPSEICSCCDHAADGSTCNCSHCRQNLFGDWFGVRTGLAEDGILIQTPLTQFYQGVASGGVEQTSKYGGKLDYFVTFDGAKMGLNEGLMVMMHAETRFGEDVNFAAGALAFPNANMLYPFPGEDTTSITNFMVMQALSENVALVAGKFNTLDLFNLLYPNTGRGIDGFMNLSLLVPTTFFRTTGLSVNGAGIMGLHEKQIQSAFLVYDTHSSSTTVAPDLFDQGAVMLGYHRFFTELNGLPGSHGFLGNYSTRTYTSTDPLDWAVIPGQGVVAGEETGSWALAYLLDQMVWADACNPARNVRLFSTWSLADGNPNPYRWSGNVQLQATGLIEGRAADTMGVGYFYDALSEEFKTLVNTVPGIDVQNIQGAELYYNAAIRPWFNLTGDIQVIENQNVGDDLALVLGLRAKINL